VKLSRDKMIQISHRVLEYMNEDERVEFFAEPQEIRQQVFRLIEAEMRVDEAIDAAVRRKIESQKRAIVEGSDEWDVLYRKYFEEEQARFKKVMP
jgi:hypothetical protein